MLKALRFFFMIRLHPSYALAILTAIVLAGGWAAWVTPGELDTGLGMLLFLQMFLVSTGFAIPARQGHFDPILTCAESRPRIAAAHYLASIAPGAAGWLILAIIGLAAGSPAAWSALLGDRMAALLIVSAVGWMAGFFLPRGAAGVIWIAALVAVLLTRTDVIPAWSQVMQRSVAVVIHAATVMLCPFVLIGVHPPLANGSVLIALFVVGNVWWLALRLTRRLDVYLVDRA
jgi:hypothetical protein